MANLYDHVMILCHFLGFLDPIKILPPFAFKSPKIILKEFDLNPRASGAQIYLPFTMALFKNKL